MFKDEKNVTGFVSMGWKDSDDKRQKQCQLDHCLCEMVINLAVRTGLYIWQNSTSY